MKKIFLIVAVVALFFSMYFFFYTKNLLSGSVSLIIAIVLNLLYAMLINSKNK